MKKIRTTVAKIGVSAFVILVTISCGLPPQEKSAARTITQEQAEQRVHQYITDAMAAIETGNLETLSTDTRECTHPTDGGPAGRVQAGEHYFIRNIPQERNPQVYKSFLPWLRRNNFRILDDTTEEDARFLWAENTKTGFRMTLKESVDGNETLSIIVVSPCVWPNGTPEPEPTY